MEEKRFSLTGKTKSLIFYIVFMAWPVAQFAIFYVGVNFNSLLLAFKDINPENYSEFTWTLSNFTTYFTDPTQLEMLGGAALVSLRAYLTSLLISVPLALFFSYYIFKRMPMASLFRVLLFMPSIIASIVLVKLFTYIMDYALPEILGFFKIEDPMFLSANSTHKFGTVMFYTIFTSFGTTVLMYSNKMSTISPEIIESAHLDGAGAFREFFHIVLPMAFPTISVFLITGLAGLFINQWNVFSFYGTTQYADLRSLGYWMYLMVYQNKQNPSGWSSPAALGLMLTAVAIPLTFTVRYLLNRFGPSED
ncbi:MAG: sugar ABC transporter permease [Clostridia bacterium]|nr:sugar ABC transporter permease [Clostridia bacterium]